MGVKNYGASWRHVSKDWPAPSEQEMLDSCIQNAEESARLEAQARVDYERAEPGSEACLKAHAAITRHKHDQAHWRDRANWWRSQLPAHPPASPAPAAPPVARVVGEDDDDERPSVWADLGGGVR
jgi:hypothetical protein